VDSFSKGPTGTTGAGHVHADIWRRIWLYHDARAIPIKVAKVMAHATKAEVAAGYNVWFKEGNAYADAGAKEGRMMHSRDVCLEGKITKSQVLVQMMARYLARVSVFGMREGDDTPPYDRSQAELRRAARVFAKKPPKHAVVPDGDRFRCLWCLHTSASKAQVEKSPCAHAGGHTLWRASGITICSKCGAYSQYCTRLLGKRCAGWSSASRNTGINRVFERNMHPVEDKKITSPIFWRKCVDQQSVEKVAVHVSRDTHEKAQFDACSELFNIAERLVPDEFCKNKGYDRSKADAGKYAEAVLGRKGIVDCNGVAIAHVGAAAVSNEERHWEPWTGFRTVRPNIRGPSCQVGSTIRNRFCFNTQERDERSRLRAERIKLIVGEAADAAHLSSHVGPDTDKLFDIDDTA